jgi:hypothetical protein
MHMASFPRKSDIKQLTWAAKLTSARNACGNFVYPRPGTTFQSFSFRRKGRTKNTNKIRTKYSKICNIKEEMGRNGIAWSELF